MPLDLNLDVLLAPGVATMTLAEAAWLVSPWKPVVLLLPFLPWAWVISKIYDKHAAQFYLNREAWNIGHLLVGLVAFAGALLIPMFGEGAFWAGLGVLVVLLLGDLLAFMLITNRSDKVPESKRLRLDFSKVFQKKTEDGPKGGKVVFTLRSPDKQVVAPPAAESPEYQIRVGAETLIAKAMAARASQVDFVPVAGAQPSYQVTFLVDGVRTSPETLPAASAVQLMDFWKTCAKLDVGERRKRLQGDVSVESPEGGGKKKVRVFSSGSNAGMRVTLLFDPEAAVKRKVDALGLLEPQLSELKAITGEEHGVVLLAAGADGGRTTTFYTVLRSHDAYTRNIQTVEMEQQDTLDGVRQNVWEPTTDGPDFATLVRSIMRRDPDLVGVAELPDANTAKEVARADQERTRTYVSMRGDAAISTLGTWLKAVGDPALGSKCLQGVVAQRLVRKLCTNCRVPYQPPPDMLKKLGLPADRVKQLYKKGGQVLVKNRPETCPVCGGVGYVGQEGAFEVYKLGDAERAAIAKGDLSALKVEFRKRGLPSIQQAALKKALDGVTSVEEVIRVTSDPTPAGATPASKAPAAV